MLITCKISYMLMNLNKNIGIKMIYLIKFCLQHRSLHKGPDRKLAFRVEGTR